MLPLGVHCNKFHTLMYICLKVLLNNFIAVFFFISRKGKMYEMKCRDSTGAILPPMILKQQLQTIMDIAGGSYETDTVIV